MHNITDRPGEPKPEPPKEPTTGTPGWDRRRI